MPAPAVSLDDFEDFTGITLAQSEEDRVEILLERASRNLRKEVKLPDDLDADQIATYKDAACQLAHLYWEAEKADVMEILALPVSQLSLGTLFWTKSSKFDTTGLWAINALLSEFGNVKRLRFVLEDELAYPE